MGIYSHGAGIFIVYIQIHHPLIHEAGKPVFGDQPFQGRNYGFMAEWLWVIAAPPTIAVLDWCVQPGQWK